MFYGQNSRIKFINWVVRNNFSVYLKCGVVPFDHKSNMLFMKNSFLLLSSLLLFIATLSCSQKPTKSIEGSAPSKHSCCSEKAAMPDWSKDAVIYEVNIRQYTPEGTFAAFRKHLPRLKEMGVEILWIMPIHPVSEVNRKGSLGSYYAVADYVGVNPEFGDLASFKAMVDEAHKLGMKVIIDWVANHTGWDNKWITEHPEWYTKDSSGKIIPPVADWTDVADLNYDNKEMRNAMTSSMVYWVKEADIDGFRCDVAGMVPNDFWEATRDSLEKIKPMFMLAEEEQNTDLLKKAFNANYCWNIHWRMNQVAQGKEDAGFFKGVFREKDLITPDGGFYMQFTSNHDENSWNKSEYYRMGKAANVMAAFTYMIPGMPLIYSGQEASMKKSLRFFDKDTIDFTSIPLADFYKQLGEIKVKNEALWNGSYGAKLVELNATPNDDVFAFSRTKGTNQVVAIFNFSDKTQKVSMHELTGSYINLMTGESVELPLKEMDLTDWGYLLLVKK